MDSLLGGDTTTTPDSKSDGQTAEGKPDSKPLDTIPVQEVGGGETAATTVAKPRRSSMIEEVVVTAQRKEESAQDVPISMTVFDGKQLANANITNSSDLAVYTPSLSTNQRFGADNATFSIRGFTQELRTTASVATYMAEVVAPRGQSSQSSGDGAGPGAMFDLANVQVLKGPQGTLFGRNTTGGAVLLVPNRPTDEFGGSIEFSGGERDSKRGQGIINVPILENLKTRLAVDFNKRDGHLTNITGIGTDKLGSVDYFSGRFSSVWRVTDSIENYTIFSYIDSHSTGYSSQLYDCNANYANGGFFLAFSGALQVPACQDQLARQAAAGKNGFYDVVSTIASPMTNIKEKRLINTATWTITDNLKLKNILAYAHLHTENGSDIFGTQFRYNVPAVSLPAAAQPVLALLGVTGTTVPLDPDKSREFKTGVSVKNPTEPVTSQETYVAELQLQGTFFESALDWQGGLYWESSLPDGFSGNNSAGLISCNMASLEGPPSGFNCFDPAAGAVGGVLVQQYKTTYLNQAAYTQGTWDFNEAWSMTLGLRYTIDSAKGYGIKTRYSFGPNPLSGAAVSSGQVTTTPETHSEAPTGLLEGDWKFLEGQMLYAKYIRGYRQGSVILAADPGLDTFKPETVNTYELGLKTQFPGPFPGRFNLAVFYNDFTNQQLQLGYISASSLQTTTIANAGKSRIQGIEGEAFIQLLDSVTLALSFSLLDTKLLKQEDETARFKQYGDTLAQASVTPIAVAGDELPYAPKQTYVTSLMWRVPLPESVGDVDAGVTYSMIGEQRSAASTSGPYGMLKAFNLLNLNVAWTRIFNSPLDFVVFGTNILNEKYVTYTSGTYNLLGYESRAVGTPQFVGARLKYNFGAAAQR